MTDTAPKVSVIIPVYNGAATLHATLDSVLTQTMAGFEVVLIDDGSTDATPEIAQAYARRDTRVRIITQENGGLADARNRGIEEARTDLIAPIDADDLWHPTYLEKLTTALDRAGPDTLLAYAGYRRIDTEGRVTTSAPSFFVSGSVLNRFTLRNFVGNGSGMVFRRGAALDAGGYERRLQHEFGAQGCEDWLLQMRLATRGEVIAVEEFLVGYRDAPDAMSRNRPRMKHSRLHALALFFDEAGKLHPETRKLALRRAKAEALRWELTDGATGKALTQVPGALITDPAESIRVCMDIPKRLIKFLGRRIKYPLLGPPRRVPFFTLDPREGHEAPPMDAITKRTLIAANWDRR